MRKLIMPLLALAAVVFSGTVRAWETIRFPASDGGMLHAALYLPQGHPRGVVIALHGCAGLFSTARNRQGFPTARHDEMGMLLSERGYAVVFPDSFGSRNIGAICRQEFKDRKIDVSRRAGDVRETIGWIRTQAWGRQASIALLGWSHGGSTILEAIDARNPPIDAAVAFAFYPGCYQANKSRYVATNVPLIMYLGELDDWTDPKYCIDLGRRAGAEVIVYADSHHDFDDPGMPLKFVPGIPYGKNPSGVHQGSNSKAREASYQHLFTSLAAMLSP